MSNIDITITCKHEPALYLTVFRQRFLLKNFIKYFLNLDNEIQNRLVLLSIKRATDDTAVFKYFVDEKSLCAS